MEIGYGSESKMPMCDSRMTQPTVEERLLRRKADLEAQLKDINSALEALQANPEILKVMCLISKVNY